MRVSHRGESALREPRRRVILSPDSRNPLSVTKELGRRTSSAHPLSHNVLRAHVLESEAPDHMVQGEAKNLQCSPMHATADPSPTRRAQGDSVRERHIVIG